MSLSKAVAVLWPVLFFSAASLCPAAPLTDKIESQTGIPLDIHQKEELSSFSQAKHEALLEARDVLVKQLAQILSLNEKDVLRALFSEVGVPRPELNPETGVKLEERLGRPMTETEYNLVDMAFKAHKEKERLLTDAYAAQVANLVDLPQEAVREMLSS